MKNFLLSCFLALGIGASAQYTYVGDFENPGFNPITYKQFGGGTQAAAAACNGSFGGQLLTTATIAQTGFMVDLSTLPQTNNGQKADISISYKKGATVAGTLQLAYFKYDPVALNYSVNYVGSPVVLAAAAITTCTTITATLPAGTLVPGQSYGVGAFFVRSGSANGAIYLDDITINQETVTTAPACTTITNPANGATISAGNLNLAWTAAPTAVNYKVTVGTTPGASNLFNGTVAGTSVNLGLAKSTLYYAKVVPSNLNGDATGCTEISFTTDTAIAYCGGITASSVVYPISSVTLNGTTKTSAATTGAPAYEDFTATAFSVKKGVSYNLSAIATGAGTNVFAMTVFVDWNEDGDFNDADEKFFQNAPFLSGTGATINLSRSMTVPIGTAVGTKRMRVKYNFQGAGTTLQPALSDACANMTNGQTEDYSIAVTDVTAAPLCTTITAPTNGATGLPANSTITWTATDDAQGYKVYIGTTPGGNEVANGVLVSGTTSYQASLAQNTVNYIKVVPTNSIGDAAGCTEISVTTVGLVYCTPTPAFAAGSVEPTTNVTIANINNTSSPTVGGSPSYEDFTSIVGTVLTGTDYTISLNANTDGPTFNHFFAVFVDWNQDGDFNDAGEKYFTTVPTFIKVLGSDGVTGTPATGTISVPSTAKLGNTRMRVKSAYYGSTGPSTDPNLTNFANACVTTGSSFGQIEDYTLLVKDVNAATASVDKSKVSVYPNPFTNVLNISDVKGVKSISISDVSGRQVKLLKPSTELNLSDLKTGLYIVNLKMEDGTVRSIKAIKK